MSILDTGLGFSTNPIMNWSIIIAVLICGYYFYLKIVKKKVPKSSEIETLLDVLAFGIVFVLIIVISTAVLSYILGNGFLIHNEFMVYSMQITMIVFASLTVLDFLGIDLLKNSNKALKAIVFFIVIILLFSYIYMQIVPYERLKLKQNGSFDNETCQTECYNNYGISYYNITNNSCYCIIK